MLREEFPAQQSRELIRDNRETIPPYQAGTGKSGNRRPAAIRPLCVRARRRQAATASSPGARRTWSPTARLREGASDLTIRRDD